MSQLNLSLLGPFEATLNEQPVTGFATDKIRGLLVYLAMAAGQPHRRETLAGLFWPDWPDAIALRNLRQSLHRLKQTLDRHQPNFTGQLLVITRQTVELNPEQLHLDVIHFQHGLAQTESHAHASLHSCQFCLNSLTQAVALYRGELMAGFSLADTPEFESWLLLERERFHHGMLAALDRLTLMAEQNQSYQQALDYAKRRLALEPWHEEAHRQVMHLLMLSGQRSEALAQFNICSQILAEELGVSPGTETMALYEAIRAGQPIEPLLPEMTTLAPALYNFAPQPTPFVGRRRELQQLLEQITHPDCRLLTLTGPGGIGKTRLSLRAAECLAQAPSTFRHGIYFVPLAAVATPDLLVSTLATVLGLTFSEHEAPRVQLLNYLSTKALLLVLDNFEHLIAGAGLLAEILATAPQLKLLLTSREPLNLRTEWRLPVTGLAYEAAAEPGEAAQFFLQTARQIQPHFQPTPQEQQWIAQICQELQGIPLALEIAAVWLRVYDLAKITQEVIHNLNLLVTPMRDLPARHRSIRAVFEQTWQLLLPPEQQLLAQVTIFQGSFEAEASLAVTGAFPLELAALVDKALLKTTPGGRYTIHELLRQFAAEKLARWETPAGINVAYQTQQQHSHYYLQKVANHRGDLGRKSAKDAVAAIQQDLDNIRAAWAWAVTHTELELMAACNWGLFTFYEIAGLFEEGEALFRAATTKLKTVLDTEGVERWPNLPETLCWLWQRQGQLLTHLGQIDQALPVSEAALRIGEQYGCDLPRNYALITYGKVLGLQGEYDAARGYLGRALAFFTSHNRRDGQVAACYELGSIEWRLGHFDRALRYYQDSLNLGYAGQDLYHIARCAGDIGIVYWKQGNYEQALHCYQQALETAELLGYQTGIARWLGNIGLVYWKWGDYERSLAYQQQAIALNRGLGDAYMTAIWQGNTGLVYADMGNDEQANSYYDQAIPVQRRLGAKFYLIEILRAKAELFFRRQDYQAAQRYNLEAIQLAAEIGAQAGLFYGQILAAKLAAVTGKKAEAVQHLQAMLQGSVEEIEQAALHDALWQLGQGPDHAQKALKLYQNLLAQSRDAYYQRRLNCLLAAIQGG